VDGAGDADGEGDEVGVLGDVGVVVAHPVKIKTNNRIVDSRTRNNFFIFTSSFDIRYT